jgi:hypothetical protein
VEVLVLVELPLIQLEALAEPILAVAEVVALKTLATVVLVEAVLL